MAGSSSSSMCTICLEPAVHPASVLPCNHNFCFACITKWANVRSVCPLCKGNIVHLQITSQNFEYAPIKANSPEAMERLERMRTTFLSLVGSEAMGNLYIESSTNFRRRLYEFGLWVQRRTNSPLDSCPELYRATDEWNTRIMQWLVRELSALSSDSTLQAAVEIFHLIRQYPIRSPDFASRIVQYTGRYTEHFVHEFHSFASSSADIFTYDYQYRNRYVVRDRLHQERAPTQEAGPSVITLSDSDDDCVFVARYLRHSSTPHEGAPTQEAGPSVIILSDSDDD